MTTDQTTAILNKIREVCPELKELSFGCEVAIDASPSPLHLKIIEPYRGRKNEWLMTEHMVWYENTEHAKIIGHTVHLEHLMRAIGKQRNGAIFKLFIGGNEICTIDVHQPCSVYNLTLTVEQNLDQNEALREWLYELICK